MIPYYMSRSGSMEVLMGTMQDITTKDFGVMHDMVDGG